MTPQISTPVNYKNLIKTPFVAEPIVEKPLVEEPQMYQIGSKTIEEYSDKIVLKAGTKYTCVLSKMSGAGLEKYIFACPLLGKYKKVYISTADPIAKQLISCFLVFAGN
jgi:hypothetical protein